jgi:hypothetical protein
VRKEVEGLEDHSGPQPQLPLAFALFSGARGTPALERQTSDLPD